MERSLGLSISPTNYHQPYSPEQSLIERVEGLEALVLSMTGSSPKGRGLKSIVSPSVTSKSSKSPSVISGNKLARFQGYKDRLNTVISTLENSVLEIDKTLLTSPEKRGDQSLKTHNSSFPTHGLRTPSRSGSPRGSRAGSPANTRSHFKSLQSKVNQLQDAALTFQSTLEDQILESIPYMLQAEDTLKCSDLQLTVHKLKLSEEALLRQVADLKTENASLKFQLVEQEKFREEQLATIVARESNMKKLRLRKFLLKMVGSSLGSAFYVWKDFTSKAAQEEKLNSVVRNKVRSALTRYMISSNRDKLVWALRSWKEFLIQSTHEEKLKEISDEQNRIIRKRVKRAIERWGTSSVKDALRFGFRSWRDFCFQDSVNQLEEQKHALVKQRVRRALERRFMYSTRDKLVWALQMWKEMSAEVYHQELLRKEENSHATAQQELIQQRVKRALERRFMYSTRDKLVWAMRTWKEFTTLAINEEKVSLLLDEQASQVRRMVKRTIERCFMSSLSESLRWALRIWKDDCFRKHHEESVLQLMQEKAKEQQYAVQMQTKRALERRFMSSVRDKLRWGFNTWKDILFTVLKVERETSQIKIMNKQLTDLHDLRRKHTKRFIERWLSKIDAGGVLRAFVSWKDFVTRCLKLDSTKRRVQITIGRRFSSSCRDLLLWSINLWKTFVVLDRHKDSSSPEDVRKRIRSVLERRYLKTVKNNLSSAFFEWKVFAIKVHYEDMIKVLVDEHAAMLRYLGGQMSVILKRNK